MRISFQRLIIGIFAVTAMAAVLGVSPTASASPPLVRAGNDEIRVWVDDLWDVYPSYDDVVISIRARHACYATVFVVDTDGYVHVVYPFSPRHNAWVRAGITYRYTAHELGLDALGGAGVAYVFAVGSRDPFDYSYYGDDIFVGRYGYRIWGDPYVACRNVYISLLPAQCQWDMVFVGSARFYVRQWVRYPSYLCRANAGVHIRVGNYCRSCSHIYDGYRLHAADPYSVLSARRPAKFKSLDRYAAVEKSVRRDGQKMARTDVPSTRQIQRERATSRTAVHRTRPTVVSTDRTVRAARRVQWNDRGSELSNRGTARAVPQRTAERDRVTDAAGTGRVQRSSRAGTDSRVRNNRSNVNGVNRSKASQKGSAEKPKKRTSKNKSSRKAR